MYLIFRNDRIKLILIKIKMNNDIFNEEFLNFYKFLKKLFLNKIIQ
jgi:hypothetical protein